MKKLFLIILPLLLLDISLAKFSYAAEPSPTPSVSTKIAPGPNPAPPIGIPCGNTICLEKEICVKYPQDKDEHCVPDPLEEEPNVPPECGDTGVFPPNSTCWNKFKKTQTDLSLYNKTCIFEPVAKYESVRYLRGNSNDQPYDMCGIGECGPDCPVSPPGGEDFDCTVAMLAYTDVRDAEMGSYGPSLDAEASYSGDFIAQNYLYNSLFGRPLDLSDKNREAYRTYWRLLPASNQANLRSFMLNMAHDDLVLNIKFEYNDTSGSRQSTEFKSLFDNLSKQIILFTHFPFTRIGCLTMYPVCPEYAQAIQELSPALSSAYSAFIPLDFSATRGYIVKRKDELEEELYQKYDQWLRDTFNAGRYGTEKPSLTNVSRENLPYVGAIYQGLLSPKFGMLPALQPQWIVDKYATDSGISDYKMGNLTTDLPEVKIASRNFLERVKEEAVAILTNPLSWVSDKVRSFFTDEDKLKGYTDLNKDNTNAEVRQAYKNMKFCPLPVSYHLLSPKTAANAKGTVIKPLDDHHQIISIPGQQLAWNFSPTSFSLEPREECPKDGGPCIWVKPTCPRNEEHYQIGETCFKRRWVVEGTKHGKALTVLNNPKQKDIKETVANNDSFSFFKMILPAGASKITDASIDAPIAKHYVSDEGAATGPQSGKNPAHSTMLNPAEPINRINNLAQDSMHILQNCWVVPEELQNSPRCNIDFPQEATISACTGEAFKKIIDNPDKPSAAAENYFNSFISPNLTAEVITAYTEAENQTGVPCEVLAGIHFKEGGNSPDQDLQSGAPLAGRTLAESAIKAAEELKSKAGGDITSLNQLIQALSYYNGGGNRNCQAGGSSTCAPTDRCGQTVACSSDVNACRCVGSPEPGSCRSNCAGSFPYPFSYPYCPSASTGYDDPYVTNLWKSPVHDQMYILYMYDCTQTRPYIDSRPGTLTVAISLFLTHGSRFDTAVSGSGGK